MSNFFRIVCTKIIKIGSVFDWAIQEIKRGLFWETMLCDICENHKILQTHVYARHTTSVLFRAWKTRKKLDRGRSDRISLTHDLDLIGSEDRVEPDGRTVGGDCITSLTNAVGSKTKKQWQYAVYSHQLSPAPEPVNNRPTYQVSVYDAVIMVSHPALGGCELSD